MLYKNRQFNPIKTAYFWPKNKYWNPPRTKGHPDFSTCKLHCKRSALWLNGHSKTHLTLPWPSLWSAAGQRWCHGLCSLSGNEEQETLPWLASPSSDTSWHGPQGDRNRLITLTYHGIKTPGSCHSVSTLTWLAAVDPPMPWTLQPISLPSPFPSLITSFLKAVQLNCCCPRFVYPVLPALSRSKSALPLMSPPPLRKKLTCKLFLATL